MAEQELDGSAQEAATPEAAAPETSTPETSTPEAATPEARAPQEPHPMDELISLVEGTRGLLRWQEETAAHLVGVQALELPKSLAPVSQRRARPSRDRSREPRIRREEPNKPRQPPAPRWPVSLDALRADLGDCKRCKLHGGRQHIVFGGGNGDRPAVFFIGEGPGRNEDEQGIPFVGPAGELLTAIIEKGMGLRREQVYIGNVVKCRPPHNRDPEPDEIEACLPFLKGQVRLVQPKVIVTLGRVAAQTLLKSSAPLGRLRGKWHSFYGVPLRATYHPAYLLRNPARKGLTWEDIQQVMFHLGLKRPGR